MKNIIKYIFILLLLTNIIAAQTPWNLTGNTPTATDFLGSTNNVDLRLYTNSAERLRILGSGNTGYVGIATITPSSVLHIDGTGTPSTTGETFRTNGVSGSDHRWRMYTNGSEIFRIENPSAASNSVNLRGLANGAMRLYSNDNQRIHIDPGTGSSSGYVGIGNGFTSPASRVHVHQGDDVTGYFQLTGNLTGSSSTDGFRIAMHNTNTAANNFVDLIQQEASGMRFLTNGSGNESARITVDGNVGIATTSPTARLHIVGAPGSSSATYSLKSEVISSTSTANPVYSIYGSSTGASRPLFGGYIFADGTTNGNSNDIVGLYLDSKNGSNLNIRIDLYATAKSGALDNLGIRAEASGSSTLNYGMNINAYGNSGINTGVYGIGDNSNTSTGGAVSSKTELKQFAETNRQKPAQTKCPH